MKVVVVGDGGNRETTRCSAAMALAFPKVHPLRDIVLQNKSVKQDISDMFNPISKRCMLHEESDYFALDGMDYLLWQEHNNKLSWKSINEIMGNIGTRMRYVGLGSRERPMLHPEETGEVICSIIDKLEEHTDVTFIDCGDVNDALNSQVIPSADIKIICVSQDKKSLDQVLLKDKPRELNEIILITDYDYNDVYNRANIHRIYGIPENRIAVMPYSMEFNDSCRIGKLPEFIDRYIGCSTGSRNYFFSKELRNTTRIVFDVMKIAGA